MSRRIRSAAFPVHRHSLPQLLVDGGLVALAYYLAFRLRFEAATPHRFTQLLDTTILWVVPVTVIVIAAFGQYERLWTFVGQRDYEAVVKAVVVATLLEVGAITLLHPVLWHPAPFSYGNQEFPGPASAVYLPGQRRSRCTSCSPSRCSLGARFLVHLVVEGRVRSFRAAKGARSVLIVGGGQGGQARRAGAGRATRSCACARSASSTMIPASAGSRTSTACKVLGQRRAPRSSPASSTRSSPMR